MSTAKNPIAILQETAAIYHWPLPLYELVPDNNGFRGTIVIGYLSESAFGLTKKRAKQLCAERVLNILNPPTLRSIASTNKLTYYNLFETKSHALEEINFNAVGRLNELCSKAPYRPAYIDIGVTPNGFTIECRLPFKTTQGLSLTKKQAKQIAAFNMLNSTNVSDFNVKLQVKCKKNINLNSLCLKKNNLDKEYDFLNHHNNTLLSIFNNLKPEEKKFAEETSQLLKSAAKEPENSTKVKQLVKQFEHLSLPHD